MIYHEKLIINLKDADIFLFSKYCIALFNRRQCFNTPDEYHSLEIWNVMQSKKAQRCARIGIPTPTCLTALSREAFHNEHARKQKRRLAVREKGREREWRKLIDLTDENEGEGKSEIAKVARAHTNGKRKGAIKAIYIPAFRSSQWHSCGRGGD